MNFCCLRLPSIWYFVINSPRKLLQKVIVFSSCEERDEIGNEIMLLEICLGVLASLLLAIPSLWKERQVA